MPKKKTPKKPEVAPTTPAKAPAMSKSDFVRSQPNMTASEVIRRGREMGLTITESLVYNVRAADKKKGPPQEGAQPMMSQAPADLGSPLLERQFRTVVVRLGLDRSEQLLQEIKLSFAPEEPIGATRKSGTGTTRSSNSKSSGSIAASALNEPKPVAPAG